MKCISLNSWIFRVLAGVAPSLRFASWGRFSGDTAGTDIAGLIGMLLPIDRLLDTFHTAVNGEGGMWRVWWCRNE